MIKEKELRDALPQVRFKDGSNITLSAVQASLQGCAESNGVPVAFRYDQIKFGGIIGGSTLDCLVLYHPDHEKDYFKFAIQLIHQGNYAFLSVFEFGTSRLMDNQASHDYMVSALKKSWNDKDSNGAEAVGAVLGAGIRRIVKGGRNNQKMYEEQNWYAMVADLFDEIIT